MWADWYVSGGLSNMGSEATTYREKGMGPPCEGSADSTRERAGVRGADIVMLLYDFVRDVRRDECDGVVARRCRERGAMMCPLCKSRRCVQSPPVIGGGPPGREREGP